MAKATAAGAAEAAATKEPVTAQAPKFSIEKLAANCRQLFGVSSCTFAGATHGMTGEYTVAEMKQHIRNWCGQEVK